MRYLSSVVLKTKSSPQELFAFFKDDYMPFLLESSQNVDGMGRYSFFGSRPFLTVSQKNGVSIIAEGKKVQKISGSGLKVLRRLLNKYILEGTNKSGIPLLCGAIGFFAYDFGFSLETIKRRNAGDPQIPDFMFGFYDCICCFDHKNNELTVFSSGFPRQGTLRKKRAEERLKETLAKLKKPTKEVFDPKELAKKSDLVSNFSRGKYLSAIKKAKEYIAAGDIYQVNLSQKFKASLAIEDWALYKRLLKNFPVSFSGFFSSKNFSIISASPERFLKFDGRRIFTRPMKGTRKRTKNSVLNRRLKRELQMSEKEKAELLMIVDLERNDLGRVCEYGTVKVSRMRQIEAYSNVFQATAEIEGILHKHKDRIDLLRACFPGGSVTGCPKIRSMEIIDELEPSCRSVYTGALGYFSFNNTMEFNILIRSFLKKGKSIIFNVGGGIVSDSKPAAEYDETLVKAKALMEALTGV